jgi:uncharacterized membrane protein
MAKKSKLSREEIMLIIGIALILIGLVGIGKLISVLLILFGAYLIYEGLRKKK